MKSLRDKYISAVVMFWTFGFGMLAGMIFLFVTREFFKSVVRLFLVLRGG